MKKLSKSFALLAVLALLVSALAFAGDVEWFDMETCEVCKSLTHQEGLMENMTWEQYDISNGIVSVTTVQGDYLDKYRTAQKDMGMVLGRLQKGEQVGLCGGCTALGMIMMKGVKSEEVQTSHGEVWLMTSDDAEVVAALQKWAARNTEEMKKHKAAKG
jgi:hypothetical protein